MGSERHGCASDLFCWCQVSRDILGFGPVSSTNTQRTWCLVYDFNVHRRCAFRLFVRGFEERRSICRSCYWSARCAVHHTYEYGVSWRNGGMAARTRDYARIRGGANHRVRSTKFLNIGWPFIHYRIGIHGLCWWYPDEANDTDECLANAGLGGLFQFLTAFCDVSFHRIRWVECIISGGVGVWLATVFAVLGVSVFGHGGFYSLIKKYDMSLLSPLTLMCPIWGVVFGISLLGEPITARLILGSVISLGGVFVLAVRRNKTLPEAGMGKKLGSGMS